MPKTFSPKPAEIERRWYLVDADGMAVGRLSTQIARLLTGKNKPIYAPHVDCGDFVIVINAAKVVLSGTKETTNLLPAPQHAPWGLEGREGR